MALIPRNPQVIAHPMGARIFLKAEHLRQLHSPIRFRLRKRRPDSHTRHTGDACRWLSEGHRAPPSANAVRRRWRRRDTGTVVSTLSPPIAWRCWSTWGTNGSRPHRIAHHIRIRAAPAVRPVPVMHRRVTRM